MVALALALLEKVNGDGKLPNGNAKTTSPGLTMDTYVEATEWSGRHSEDPRL